MSRCMVCPSIQASTTQEALRSNGVAKILFRLLRKVQISH